MLQSSSVFVHSSVASFIHFPLTRKFALSKSKVTLNNVVLPFSVVS